MPAGRQLPAVTRNRNYPQPVKHLKPVALGQVGDRQERSRYPAATDPTDATDPREVLRVELEALYEAAGRPTADSTQRACAYLEPPVHVPRSKLTNWRKGTNVPANDESMLAVVQYWARLARSRTPSFRTKPASAWRRLRAEADIREARKRGPASSARTTVSTSSFLLTSDAAWESHWLPRARGVEPDSGDEGWYFTGRTALLNDLVEWLETAFNEQPERAPVTVVTGAPGTGKSALLAHLVLLTVPDLVPRAYRDAVPGARPGLVSVAVHGRGKDLAAVVGEIAQALGSSVTDPIELIRYVNTRRRPLAVVVDALDEIEPDAWRGVCRLLATLAGDPAGVGVRVLVSVRRPVAATELEQVVRLLGRSRKTIGLDLPPHLSQHDLSAYVEQRLVRRSQLDDGPGGTDSGSPTPYAEKRVLARRVAMAVARRAAGNYLVAQLVSRYLTEAADVVDMSESGWSDQFPETVETALDEYLARIDDTRGRRRIHDLLMPLAFALGEGLTGSQVWAALTAALADISCDRGDITALLDTAAGFLVDRSPRGSYRLYHSSMERYLRLRCRHPAPQEAIVAALVGSVPATSAGRWAAADPYVTRHLVEHARAAGDDTLGRLLSDDDLVLHAEPASVWRSLSAPPRALREVARAYQRVAHHFTADIGVRAAYLRLSARQADVERFAEFRHPEMPWLIGTAMWESQPDHEVLFALTTYPRAAWLSCGPDASGRPGPVRVLTSLSRGELTLVHIADGIVQDDERWVGHDNSISAVGGCETDDSRLLVVTGDDAGYLFLTAVDDALLLPLAPHAYPMHDAEVASIAVAPAGGDAVYCVSGDAQGERGDVADRAAQCGAPFSGIIRQPDHVGGRDGRRRSRAGRGGNTQRPPSGNAPQRTRN